MSDLMREEFEKGWGYTNEEQECYFISELNCYGSARVNRAAESKSIAWVYFKRGWKSSRECLAIELPEEDDSGKIRWTAAMRSIESAGVKTR